jgi:hypothetical protein
LINIIAYFLIRLSVKRIEKFVVAEFDSSLKSSILTHPEHNRLVVDLRSRFVASLPPLHFFLSPSGSLSAQVADLARPTP